MDKNVTTIFLSIALTISFTQLATTNNPEYYQWFLFFYFIFRKVGYYAFDVRFADLTETIFKEETKTERMFNFFFGISTLFLFIVTGYFVIEPIKFFFFNSATLFINIFWMIILIIAIDDTKDRNPKLPIKRIFKNFIWINIVEIVFCMTAGLLLKCEFTLDNLPFAETKPYIYLFLVGGLFLIFIVDTVLHKDFLFDPRYSTAS